MPLPEPPTYDVASLERIARRFVQERFGADLPIPVDVEWLLEQMEGVDLDIWPGLRGNHGLGGACEKRGQRTGKWRVT